MAAEAIQHGGWGGALTTVVAPSRLAQWGTRDQASREAGQDYAEPWGAGLSLRMLVIYFPVGAFMIPTVRKVLLTVAAQPLLCVGH